MTRDPDEPGEAERAAIADRLAEVARIKREAAANGKPGATVLLPTKHHPRQTDTAKRVRAAADEMAAEGLAIAPRYIAARIGLGAGVVSQAITRMRRSGDWEHGNAEPGPGPKLGIASPPPPAPDDPIERLVQAIGDRVIEHIIRRLTGEEGSL